MVFDSDSNFRRQTFYDELFYFNSRLAGQNL